MIYYSDSRSAIHRYGIMPALRATLDPETAHRFAVRALGSGLAPKDMVQDQASLSAEVV